MSLRSSKSNNPERRSAMTYRQLGDAIKIMTQEQLNMDVTVHDDEDDEFFSAKLKFQQEDDVLDHGHPFLEFQGE
jgi:hypothetical protein